jgi:hypothetical protein
MMDDPLLRILLPILAQLLPLLSRQGSQQKVKAIRHRKQRWWLNIRRFVLGPEKSIPPAGFCHRQQGSKVENLIRKMRQSIDFFFNNIEFCWAAAKISAQGKHLRAERKIVFRRGFSYIRQGNRF